MGVIADSIAAASATVGTDLLEDNRLQTTPYDRWITGIKVTGSAAAGDTKLELWVGEVRVGEFFNTATGFADEQHTKPLMVPVPAGTKIHLIVVTAPSTNPINFEIYTVP